MKNKRRHQHTPDAVSRTVSRFFAVRGLMRTTLAQGKRLDPSAWLRVETLRFIASRPEVRAKDIADYLSITAPSATSLVSGLVRDGLVCRGTSKTDRRARALRLSVKGTHELEKALARGVELIRPMLATLSREELAEFTRLLERILEDATEC